MTTPLASGTTVSTDASETTTAAAACFLGDFLMNTGCELIFTFGTSSSVDDEIDGPLSTDMIGLKGATCAGDSVVVVILVGSYAQCAVSRTDVAFSY